MERWSLDARSGRRKPQTLCGGVEETWTAGSGKDGKGSLDVLLLAERAR